MAALPHAAASSLAAPCLTHSSPAQIANEVEGAPESWLMWVGIYKLLLGKKRHANWHWTDESRKRPTPMALFIARSENPEWFEVLGWRLERSPLRPFMRLIALGYEFEAWQELPQTLRDVVLFVPRLFMALVRFILRRPAPEAEEEEEEEGSEESAETAGRHERLRKRLCAAAGLFGIYSTWTIFAWFIFTCASRAGCRTCVCLRSDARPASGADGMLIYNQLGSAAESQFANQWGVGYAMDNASEWKDVCVTAVKTALILVVLDLLRITKDRPWFEEHSALCRICSRCRTCGFIMLTHGARGAGALVADFVSVQVRAMCRRFSTRISVPPDTAPRAQAMLFNGAARSWWTQTKVLVRYQTRLTDD